MEDQEVEKVYVAVGNDLKDGFKTLDWTLKKWNYPDISIVILHICKISEDFVHTPFGKLPASSVNEEKLEVLKKLEEEKRDKLLSKYISFCGKVKAEILKVEKHDNPIENLMVDLISKLKITKLVIGLTCMKSSSWRAKSATVGSFYINQHKPNFCEIFIICGGKSVLLQRENYNFASFIENKRFRGWFGKMFTRNLDRSSSADNGDPTATENPWDKNVQDLENYFQELLSFNLDEEENTVEEDDVQTSSMEAHVPEHLNAAEYLKNKIDEAQQKIQTNKKDAKANAEAYLKAERAIRLCNCRVEELDSWIKKEAETRTEMEKTLDSYKERLHEIARDIDESRNKKSSLSELRKELSNKLQALTMVKLIVEAKLKESGDEQTEIIREIEKLRHQKDVFNRRIEFCREREELGFVSGLSAGEVRCPYREYTGEEVRLATDGFSDRLRMKSGGNWTNVYHGRLNHITVAVKMLGSVHEDFRAEVGLLSELRHPHLVSMMGFCSEPKCMVFEYMHNGSLRDNLITSQRNSTRINQNLKWHDRIRIAKEICSALGFLHSVKPKPMVHGHLTPSKVLLDSNLVAKITVLGIKRQTNTKPDIRDFGVLLLHLLTGGNWPGLVEATKMNQTDLVRNLDVKAGNWPLDLAKEFTGLATKCLSVNRIGNTELGIGMVMAELGEIKRRADELVVKTGHEEGNNG